MTESNYIPIVDLGPFNLTPSVCVWNPDNADPDVVDDVASQIADALTNVGFVYFRNHGVPKEQLDAGDRVGINFFALPDETKSKFCWQSYEEGYYGWSGKKEKLNPARPPDFKEAYEAVPFGAKAWPDDEAPGFKETTLSLVETNHNLGQVILYLMAVGLGLDDRECFTKFHNTLTKPSRTALRYAQYQAIPADADLPSGTLRCGEHSDWDSITLLYQDSHGGLEVMNREGKYVPATPIEGTVVCNIGDVMQRWTSDRYVSTKHRVVMPEVGSPARSMTRRSIAFFYHPDDDNVMTCVDGSNKYEPMTSYDYVHLNWSKVY